MDDNQIRKQKEADNFRLIAFFGVSISTISTLVCVISVPLLYGYLQKIQSDIFDQVDFCKMRTKNIWKEMAHTQVNLLKIK